MSDDNRRPASRIHGMDGLRAIAAMLVVAYHSGSLAGATSAGPLALIAAELKAGVAVFFVISGFLLYLPFARAIGAGRTSPNWREYAARRAVRILPAYWAALAMLAAVGELHGVSLGDAWRFIGLGQIYSSSTLGQGLPVAWSLDVEVTFYLVLPVLAWIAARMARGSNRSGFEQQLTLIVGLALGSLVLRLMLARSLLAPVEYHLGLATALPGMIDWFALGMALAVWRSAAELGTEGPRWLNAVASRPGLCWLVALALYLLGVPAQGGEVFLASFGVAAHAIVGVAAFFLVLPVVAPRPATQRGLVLPFLRSGLLTWLGTISYGIYLWHVSFLRVVDPLLGVPRGVLAFLGLLLLTSAGAVCLGAASWYLVERPAHRAFRAGWIPLTTALGRPAGEVA